MPWVKLDDQYAEHPKIRAVGAIGLALQTAAICYCGRYLTDGFLSFSAADALLRSVLAPLTKEDGSVWTIALTSGSSGEDAQALDWKLMMIEAGLWEQRNSGYHVHDYLDYNPSKKEYRQTVRNKRIAGQAGGQASAEARAQRIGQQNPSTRSTDRPAESNPVPVPVPVLKESTKTTPGTPRRSVLADLDFLDAIRKNLAYQKLNFDRELAKLDAWLLTPRGRGKKKTRGRIVAWLNRALEDVPLEPGKLMEEEPYGFER